MNVFSNFIPNKIITCNDKDPPWINDFIRNKIAWKNQLYRNFKDKAKTDDDLFILEEATAVVSKLISDERSNYYQKLLKKLCDPKTNSKTIDSFREGLDTLHIRITRSGPVIYRTYIQNHKR